MEVRYNLRRMSEFGGEDPRRFFICAFVASPPNKVQELAGTTTVVDLRVEDLQNLKLWFSVDFNWRRRRLDVVRNYVRSCGFQHGHMKYGVDHVHGVRESESEGVGCYVLKSWGNSGNSSTLEK